VTTNVLGKPVASIFHPEDGSEMFFRSVSNSFLQNYTPQAVTTHNTTTPTFTATKRQSSNFHWALANMANF
jgi:hypothetical protein